jgi:hypothetical protein
VALSAVFTLFLIPVIYTKLDRFSMASRRPSVEPDETVREVPEPELQAV